MRITVRLFAILKDRAGGVGEMTLELPDRTTVSAAVEQLVSRYPAIKSDCHRIAFAVNRDYVKPDQVLAEGDELALIPPVSGG